MWPAQLEEYATLGLGVMSLSLTLGVEITLKKKKRLKKFQKLTYKITVFNAIFFIYYQKCWGAWVAPLVKHLLRS